MHCTVFYFTAVIFCPSGGGSEPVWVEGPVVTCRSETGQRKRSQTSEPAIYEELRDVQKEAERKTFLGVMLAEGFLTSLPFREEKRFASKQKRGQTSAHGVNLLTCAASCSRSALPQMLSTEAGKEPRLCNSTQMLWRGSAWTSYSHFMKQMGPRAVCPPSEMLPLFSYKDSFFLSIGLCSG